MTTSSPSGVQAAASANLSATQWGMLAFLLSEAAFFSTLIVTYLTYVGKDKVGPTPREALSLPLVLFTTLCLVTSSATIHLAVKREHRGAFCCWWFVTIALGVVFLAGTALEWRELIETHRLTLSRNLFGTTYYTLVGFHGLHVTLGVLAMMILLLLVVGGQFALGQRAAAELVSWYWHFVDGVWIVVFGVVYVISRFLT